MIQSPKIRRRIVQHHLNNMSHRAIAGIYGCSEGDVENVIKTETAERIILSGVPVSGGVALYPVQSRDADLTPQIRLFKALPEDVRTFASGVAKTCKVPVGRLFTSNSKRKQDVFCRGCFYYGLSCQFHWNYERIAHASGVSVHVVCRAVNRYCTQVGAPRPSELLNARRAVV
ncbi:MULTISPECIES: hypothetical protein [unclassified Pseudovibrio]|uniref:hypothetical protein n=1 Tax=unclassified Pseudovibrio TaxID=2627060 RepID=UPI0007AEDE66|nr:MULTISPECIES: hypothetical protein [unclassified Pseudovibrio]KZK95029.1 hypothetical protein PsW74_04290 [Pseudovibrio sp. W74]KZL08832.1 hypothetical protein PsAD14_02776 [Pseudovibrio sp. Ad14]